ncbi:MAG: YfdX family protein [Thermoproteota archaeon]
MQLKTILDEIQEDLKKRDEAWEEVKNHMRRATHLSKQAILQLHQNKKDKARNLLQEAEKLFSKLNKISQGHPDLAYTGIVDSAFQEYTEAQTFLSLVEKDRFIPPENLGIPLSSYVLGIPDVVGEFRRKALDELRKGQVDEAEKCLQTMENIYIQLTSMDQGYRLVSGLRRKCDVSRRIIESTRGDVTIEVRRKSLAHSITKLQKTLKEGLGE